MRDPLFQGELCLFGEAAAVHTPSSTFWNLFLTFLSKSTAICTLGSLCFLLELPLAEAHSQWEFPVFAACPVSSPFPRAVQAETMGWDLEPHPGQPLLLAQAAPAQGHVQGAVSAHISEFLWPF